MKETEELQRTSDVEAELIEETSTFTVRKKKTWKVFLTIAASVLLVVGVLFGWIYSNSNKVELDENGKIDIYTIKGAEKDVKKILDGGEVSEILVEPCPKEEYIAKLKKSIETSEEAVVYGTAKNIKMVTIKDRVRFSKMKWEHFEDGSSIQKEQRYKYPVVWWIVTFDIDVIDDMGTLDGRGSVHVVLASRYATGDTNGDSNFRLKHPMDIKEMLEKIQENPTGVFRLRNFTVEQEKGLDESGIPSNGNLWEIRGKTYRAVEFADYFVKVRYDCDGEKFRYNHSSDYLYTVYLDELRVQKEE